VDLGTHDEECWAQEDMWYTTRGATPWMRTLGGMNHHGRGSIDLTTCWILHHLGGRALTPRGIMLGVCTTLGLVKTLV
jgi:hypothetical protein